LYVGVDKKKPLLSSGFIALFINSVSKELKGARDREDYSLTSILVSRAEIVSIIPRNI
jgi:hypothetical protein